MTVTPKHRHRHVDLGAASRELVRRRLRLRRLRPSSRPKSA